MQEGFEHAREMASSIEERAIDITEQAMEKAVEFKEAVFEKASEIKEAVVEKASEVVEKVQEYMQPILHPSEKKVELSEGERLFRESEQDRGYYEEEERLFSQQQNLQRQFDQNLLISGKEASFEKEKRDISG